MTTVTSPWAGLGQPLFEMCWVYMAIAQIAQDLPLCQTDKRGKKCSKPSWQALTPPGKFMQKKMLQTILASLYTSPILRKRGYS